MSADKNHSEQFEKYLKGELSPAETHSFEREALDDDFTRDALEGFEEQGVERLEDLAALKDQIAKPKSVPWIRIASAAALLLIGSLAIYISLNQVDPQEQIATNEDLTEEEAISKKEIDANPLSTEESAEEQSEIEEVANEELQTELAEDEFEIVTEEEVGEENPILAADLEEDTSEDQIEIDVAISDFQGLQVAQVDAEATSEPLVSTYVQTNPAESRKSRSDAGIAANVRSFSDVNLTEETVLEEIVFEDALGSSSTEEPNRVTPLIGWTKYNSYLSDSLRYPLAAKSESIQGRVFVMVETDSIGNILRSTVMKGIGYGCDEEALRLINEGPKFEADSIGGRAIIPVSFTIK